MDKDQRRIMAIGILFFLSIVLFEASQQYYYVTTFKLNDAEEIRFSRLLKGQVFRWIVWLLCSLPLIRCQLRSTNSGSPLRPSDLLKFLVHMSVALCATIIIISLVQLYMANGPIRSLGEYVTFYTFQKVPIFLAAYFCLFVTIHLYLNVQDLDSKVSELSMLKDRYHTLYQEMRASAFEDDTQIIRVKIGNKVKLIPVGEIIWIQSDDYCVKLHTTKDRSYPVRTSMKAIEQSLSDKGFVRIHRNAIINIQQLRELHADKDPKAILKNGKSLRVANSRLSVLRKQIDGKNAASN